MVGFINSGLSSSSNTLQALQNVFGTFLDNQQKKQGLFTSGLERARQDRFDAQFRRNQEGGLDPLRNTLSLFRNADNATDAARGLGAFTSLRQPAASASLFDANATGIDGLAGSATGLVRQGLGGLNAAFGLEQQNLALRLSDVGNSALNIGQLQNQRLRRTNTLDTSQADAAVRPIYEYLRQQGVPDAEAQERATQAVTGQAPGATQQQSNPNDPFDVQTFDSAAAQPNVNPEAQKIQRVHAAEDKVDMLRDQARIAKQSGEIVAESQFMRQAEAAEAELEAARQAAFLRTTN